jgi:hypothetical protein
MNRGRYTCLTHTTGLILSRDEQRCSARQSVRSFHIARRNDSPSFLVVILLISPYQLATACTTYIGDVQLSRNPRPEARGEELSQTVKPIFSWKTPMMDQRVQLK